ncbi:hypothetical protein D3C72_1582470 [compost metagenome]
MGTREASDDTADVTLIIVNGDAAVGVDDLVVPSGDLLMRLVLAWVPVRRDVGIAGTEHHHDFVPVGDVLPDRIGAGDMRLQDAQFGSVRVEFERNVIGIQPALPMRKEGSERMRDNQLVHPLGAGDFKVSGYVHGCSDILVGCWSPFWWKTGVECRASLMGYR